MDSAVKNEFMPRPKASLAKSSRKRSPNGQRQFSRQVGAQVTEEQYETFRRNGGSIWLRNVLDGLMAAEQSSTSKEP